MRIADSSINMFSSRNYVEEYEKSERMKYWVGNQRPLDGEANNGLAIDISQIQEYKLEISEQAKSLLADNKVQDVSSTDETDTLSPQDKLKVDLIERFVELFTGKKIKIKLSEKIKTDNKECPKLGTQNNVQQQEQPKKVGWGFEYDSHKKYHEKEVTQFEAKGIIKTADGKEIQIDVDLNMSREFMSQQDISIRAGDAAKVDPLVINYDGHSANITQTKYSFDIDSDGEQENISFAGLGSGFLALDVNGDGKVNDGSELFGPQSGNGFDELSKYDEDKNGWIDESDLIYNNLRIWTKDDSGKDYLVALGEKGIGAIYLGNVGTQFSINNAENIENGQVVRTGIFLRENGTAGTIQHIDLSI